MRWMDSIINAMNMNLGKLWEMVRDMEACHDAVHGVTKGQTWLVTEQQQQHQYEAYNLAPILQMFLLFLKKFIF